MEIPLPSIEEQRSICIEVDRQMSIVDAAEAEVARGLGRATSLRRSILNAAFEGGLVDQDPDDEPAAVLLEPIRGDAAIAAKPRLRKAEA